MSKSYEDPDLSHLCDLTRERDELRERAERAEQEAKMMARAADTEKAERQRAEQQAAALRPDAEQIMAKAKKFASEYMAEGCAVMDHAPTMYDRGRDRTRENEAALRADIEQIVQDASTWKILAGCRQATLEHEQKVRERAEQERDEANKRADQNAILRGMACSQQREARECAEQEAAAQRADAERYRWLRDESIKPNDTCPNIVMMTGDCQLATGQGWSSILSGEKADAAIDAAMGKADPAIIERSTP